MNSLTAIKQGVNYLFKTHPHVHVNVSLAQPKVHLKNHPVTITGVYPNIFQLEDRTGDSPSIHIVQYVELMMGHVEITELMKKIGTAINAVSVFAFDMRKKYPV